MNGPIAVVILIIGLVGASILSRHLRQAKQLRLLEIAHEERIKAMDTGNTLPDTADGRLDSLLRDLSAHEDPSPKNPATAVMWVRLAALCLGLAGLFGGIGTSIAFSAVSDAEVNGL